MNRKRAQRVLFRTYLRDDVQNGVVVPSYDMETQTGGNATITQIFRGRSMGRRRHVGVTVCALMMAIIAMVVFSIQPAHARLTDDNPPYEIEIVGEGADAPQLEFTINFENGSSLLHVLQGNGITPFENPGYGRIVSITLLGKTVSEGEEIIIPTENPTVSYRLIFWWFDLGYRCRTEKIWA